MNARREVLAQQVAAGVSKTEALKEAGYSPSPGNSALFRRDDVMARVEELREVAAWGAGADPVNQKLAALARQSAELGSAVGLLGAGKLVIETAKRRDRLEAGASADACEPEPAPAFTPPPQLSVDQWIAKYGR